MEAQPRLWPRSDRRRLWRSIRKIGAVLHLPEAFEPLTEEPWDERRVSNAIRAIVADTDDRTSNLL